MLKSSESEIFRKDRNYQRSLRHETRPNPNTREGGELREKEKSVRTEARLEHVSRREKLESLGWPLKFHRPRFPGECAATEKRDPFSWNLFCLVARIPVFFRRGGGGERGWSVAALKAVPSGLASAGRFTRRHGRIGVEMRGKRRLLFINEPSSSNEGRASGWSWLNEHWATIHHPERKKLIISARTLIRFFLNATDPLIKAESRCRIRFHCGQGKRIAPRSNRFVCAIRTYIYIYVRCVSLHWIAFSTG